MPKNYCIMQIWAESGKSALPICNYSQILYQFLTFTQNLKRSHESEWEKVLAMVRLRCSDLHHIFKLTHVQIVVEAFLCKQLRCIALFDDAAVVDDEDPVGLLDRGKAVCNDKGGTPF